MKIYDERMKRVSFTADDVNDAEWDDLVKVLRDRLPGFEVWYMDGHRMAFEWKNEKTE